MENYIVKRDGKREVFSIDKIKNAIARSFLAAGSFATQEIMTGILGHLRITDGISVEEIQNQVEVALILKVTTKWQKPICSTATSTPKTAKHATNWSF